MDIYLKLKIFLIICLFTIFNSSISLSNEKFNEWLIEFKGRAINQGVSKDTVDNALKNAKFLERIVALDRKQPEFFEKTYEYLDKRVNEARIREAKKLLSENSILLQKVNAKFKVNNEILVALWGIETNFGVNKGKVDIISALSTLSFDNRRSEYFEKELIILLKLIDKKIVKYESLYGSWAGAIGNFQFMPSTIQNYALNFDENSDIDLINSFQDSLASAANYLKTIGWNEKDIWGFEIQTDKEFDKNLISPDSRNFKNKITIAQLKLLGFKNKNGSEISITDKKEGWLIRPDGEDGPIYIVFDNFLRLLEWNRSLRFAITVGTLSDKIKI
ncbi:lytic murein transglycosylase [Candidatus Fonsibacter ubiquis]|jgi:membrane-bound lytic murein transglycosylase B|uniref:lytic murein transglycosylase n=1 Tax=Candidatus Fonsibacter ubiquis TaxID=1925548 RepID=UPI000C077CD9|nr:lytic murein transglycosylase [Candidatus Fonsibacter ubiquis]